MPQIPKDLTSNFFPGLGDQHVVGLAGVGVHVIHTTMYLGTYKSNANLVAAPTNISGLSYGPVVHSHGAVPTAAFAMLSGDDGQLTSAATGHAVTFAYITADNSAVYFRPRAWTGTPDLSVQVRVVTIR